MVPIKLILLLINPFQSVSFLHFVQMCHMVQSQKVEASSRKYGSSCCQKMEQTMKRTKGHLLEFVVDFKGINDEMTSSKGGVAKWRYTIEFKFSF